MNEKRFVYGETDLFEWVEDNGKMISTKECVNKLNEQQDTIITLKRRLEKINGGYGHLTHRNGLTANEWLIESQERELQKKNEQISDWIEQHSKDIEKISEQQATISDLKDENEQLKEERNYFERKKCEYFNKYNKKHLDNIQLKEENEKLKKRLYLYEISEDEVDKYLRTHPMPTSTNERTITPFDMRHKRCFE